MSILADGLNKEWKTIHIRNQMMKRVDDGVALQGYFSSAETGGLVTDDRKIDKARYRWIHDERLQRTGVGLPSTRMTTPTIQPELQTAFSDIRIDKFKTETP